MKFDALKDLMAFLSQAPTAWHATQQMGNRFAQQDFTPLYEEEKWDLKPGESYFVQRGGSLCAFVMPKQTPQCATILASHTDSPALKLKPHPVFIEHSLPFLRVETYGSPILATWLNRDLVIAGRVLISNGDGEVEEKLVFLESAPMLIPSLAIHLDRETNENPKKIDKQEQLCPLMGLGQGCHDPDAVFSALLSNEISHKTLLGFDLYLVPYESPRILGSDSSLLASYRLDNLVSAHAALLALLGAQKPSKETLQMAIFWNHEEVGSGTDEGASSPFFLDILKRISLSYKMGEEDFLRMKHASYFVSIDLAHAFHPNYKKKYDQKNAPEIGKGVVIKYNANHRYATNGVTAAKIVKTCLKEKIPYQSFASESNLACGSTVGSLTATRTGIPTVDIGIAQFSMHASRELIAIEDHLHLCKLLKSLMEC